ncbi:hypothetical protein [Mixta intestinalis]|jgi:hypothetical protein|uniref:Uncharacterized protein n=1 Tax=Mixta intestinalis TaxID=1615494 RepID=A0A6P1PZR1_9GAMM|nr:hypothetical protein [Mixta intestinalis]QHM71661.1 hypothetical protein C7M51_01952 [Mixta intestinalis]
MKEKLTIDQKLQIATIAGRMFESTRDKGVSLSFPRPEERVSAEENAFRTFYQMVERIVTGEPEHE